jgi:hypothetical protein
MDCIHMAEDKDSLRGLAKTVMSFVVSHKGRKFHDNLNNC